MGETEDNKPQQVVPSERERVERYVGEATSSHMRPVKLGKSVSPLPEKYDASEEEGKS